LSRLLYRFGEGQRLRAALAELHGFGIVNVSVAALTPAALAGTILGRRRLKARNETA
jgi:hypothetical protein